MRLGASGKIVSGHEPGCEHEQQRFFPGSIRSIGADTVVGKPSLENPSTLAYSPTKGALETLVKNWAAILGPRGIRVNEVAPEVVDTDMSDFTTVTLGIAGAEANWTRRHRRQSRFWHRPVRVGFTGASISVDGGSKL
jgi:NAD(P)-dependent dehydrogenase (short-subunit alcohol dehydrogenase family)